MAFRCDIPLPGLYGGLARNMCKSTHPDFEPWLASESHPSDCACGFISELLWEKKICRFCSFEIKGKFGYRCVADCKLILDINCATLPKFLLGNFTEHEHFSHQHPLVSIFIDEYQVNEEYKHCDSCWEFIYEGTVYICLQCNFWMHSKCFDLHRKINHPIHRKHKLILVLDWEDEVGVCGMCDEPIGNWPFFYNCRFCKFFLHVDCISLWPMLENVAHPHPLNLLMRTCEFTCDLSRRKKRGGPYVCVECNITMRKDFADWMLQPVDGIPSHDHKFVQTFSTTTEETEKVKCVRCCYMVNTRVRHWACKQCDNVYHLLCAKNIYVGFRSPHFRVVLPVNSSSTSKENESTRDYESNEEHLAKILQFGNVGDQGLTGPIVIQHALHDKPLYRGQHFSTNDGIRCYACWLPITDLSMFGCVEHCQLVLHETCAFLSRKLEHWFHPHTLTLQYDGEIIFCNACNHESNCFYYICDQCTCCICVHCQMIQDELEHPGHTHPLSFEERLGEQTCNACGNHCWESNNHPSSCAFTCSKCSFFAHYSCLILPKIARIVYHDHLLTLSFKDNESIPNRMVCNICEENRDPEHWFYSCKDCESTPSYFKAHTKCVLGKHPFIGMRMTTYMSYSHKHALEIIRADDYPKCDQCKELIEEDIALECHESDCNYTQHWKCP